MTATTSATISWVIVASMPLQTHSSSGKIPHRRRGDRAIPACSMTFFCLSGLSVVSVSKDKSTQLSSIDIVTGDGTCSIEPFPKPEFISARASQKEITTGAYAVIDKCVRGTPSRGGVAKKLGECHICRIWR